MGRGAGRLRAGAGRLSLASATLATLFAAGDGAAQEWEQRLKQMDGIAAAGEQRLLPQLAQGPGGPARPFQIAPQPLDRALTAFSAETRIQILVEGELTRGKSSAAVSGAYTPEQALRRLLTGTGLDYRFIDPNTVTLERSAAQQEGGPVRMGTIAVEGGGGFTRGYKAEATMSATKTPTAIRDIPASIQVVTPKVLEDQQVLRLADALRNVSGGTSTSIGEGGAFAPRGFTASLFQDGFLRSNFPSGEIAVADLDLYNVERVEVLKGPASILYGRGNPGGTINLVTKKPLPEHAYAATLQAGSHALYRPSLDFTGPLTDDKSLLYRFNAAYENANSFRDHVETERVMLFPSVAWHPNASTTLTLDAEHVDVKTVPDSGLPRRGNGVVPGVPWNRFLGEPTDRFKIFKTQVRAFVESELEDDWSLRSGVVVSDTERDERSTGGGALRADGRTLNRNFFRGDLGFKDVILQTDVTKRFSTGPLRHTALVGIEAGRREMGLSFTSGSAPPIDIFNPVYGNDQLQGNPFRFAAETNTNHYALYFQDQIDITEQLILVAGGRYDYLDENQVSGSGGNVIGRPQKLDKEFSPRFGVVFKPVPPVSLYAQYSESFIQTDGVQVAVDGSALGPHTARIYEAGIKAELLDGRLASTLAVYDLRQKNVPAADLDNPGFRVPAGEQKSRGIEIDLSGEIVPGWRVIAAAAYIDAEIVRDNAGNQGKTVAGIPEYSASLWSTYEIQDGALQGLGFGGGVQYVAARQGNSANTFEAPSYTRVDATVYYLLPRYTLRLNLNNLLDDEILLSPRGGNFFTPAAPLNVIASIQARF